MSGCEWTVEAHGCAPDVLTDLERMKRFFVRLIEGMSLHLLRDGLASVPGHRRHHGSESIEGIAHCLPHLPGAIQFALPKRFLLPPPPAVGL